MAQYEFSSANIQEALERFRELSADLNAVHEDLNTVLAQWQDTLPEELRRHLGSAAADVANTANYAESTYQTLEKIVEIYTLAEHSAFEGKDYQPQKTPTVKIIEPPPGIKPANTVLFGDLVLPDWLRAAVIKYEQSQLFSDERKSMSTN